MAALAAIFFLIRTKKHWSNIRDSFAAESGDSVGLVQRKRTLEADLEAIRGAGTGR